MNIDYRNNLFLIIDDLSHIRTTIKSMLEYFGAQRIISARNGEEALKQLSEQTFDYLITHNVQPI